MKVGELKAELAKYPDNLEVEVEYRYEHCTCEPGDQYCYCGYREQRDSINAVLIEEHELKWGGNKPVKLKKPKLIIRA